MPKVTRAVLPAVLAVLAALFALLVACNGDEGNRTGLGILPEEETATGSPSSSGLTDGDHFVIVRGLQGEALVADPAEFLSGARALEAARADGVVGLDEDLPNDVYIRNPDEAAEVVEIASDASFTLIGFDATGGLVERAVARQTFIALMAGGDSSGYHGFTPDSLPMSLALRDGVVVSGRQQYLP